MFKFIIINFLILVFANLYAFELVTYEEAYESFKHEEKGSSLNLLSENQNLRPTIHVKRPQLLSKPLSNPLSIELIFLPLDSPLLPETFKAYYGFFRVDITERILNNVTVGSSGVNIENAEIPSGKHKIFISIEDKKGRLVERSIRFIVENQGDSHGE